ALASGSARGGGWSTVGAGTGGGLGCADAAELPPTFGFPAERVEGLIAGGPAALLRARRGAGGDGAGAGGAPRGRRRAPRAGARGAPRGGRAWRGAGASSRRATGLPRSAGGAARRMRSRA